MIISTERTESDGTATVTLDGRFDAHETADFRRVQDELEADGFETIIVNMTQVEFVDSTALAELVRGMKRARERGGDLILADLSNPVRVILELTRLDSAFQIV